jgi:hypothetical protein
VGKQYDDAFLLKSKKLMEDYGRWNVTSHVFTILQRKKREYEKKNDLKGFTELVNGSKELYTPEEFTKYSSILLKDFGVEKVVVKPNTAQK